MCDLSTFLENAKKSFEASVPDAYAVLIFNDRFEVLTYEDLCKEQIREDKLLDIRVFDASKEKRICRDYVGNKFGDIIELDDDAMKAQEGVTGTYDDCQFLDVDSDHERRPKESGYVRATGGGIYRFPIMEGNDDIMVRIRNYIACDENGQAYIKAWRLLGFCAGGQKTEGKA